MMKAFCLQYNNWLCWDPTASRIYNETWVFLNEALTSDFKIHNFTYS